MGSAVSKEEQLLEASYYGKYAKVLKLLDAGVSVNAKSDVVGLTALHQAAHAGHLGVVKALVGAGADLQAKDIQGSTALDKARKTRHSTANRHTVAVRSGALDEVVAFLEAASKAQPQAQQQAQQAASSSSASAAASTASSAAAASSASASASAHLAARAQASLERDGFALKPLLASDMADAQTLRSLQALLTTDPSQLGKGKDVQRAYGPYDQLQLACAWKIDHPRNRKKYEAGVERVQEEMDLLDRKGKNVVNVPGLPVKTAAASRTFGLKQDANESVLLHGTNPSVLLSLLSTGLNERYSGSNAGTAFGDGVYLAEDVGKTDQYVTPDTKYDPKSDLHKRLYGRTVRHPGDVFYLLVCRVALGYPIRTQAMGRDATSMDDGQRVFPISFRELANVSGVQPPITHHSLIAELGAHIVRYREFVVFHGDYVSPEYLIAYQRFSGDQQLSTSI